MTTVNAIPRPDSYVIEWAAVQVCGPDDHMAVKRLCRHSPWNVQIVLEENDTVTFLFTQVTNNGIEQWPMRCGDWVVKSPHGRFWFMSDEEFRSQFDV